MASNYMSVGSPSSPDASGTRAAYESFRFDSFSPNYSHSTRRQLSQAGFLYRLGECHCPFCGVSLDLTREVDENEEYKEHHFRVLHRTKVTRLGKHCPFLLCQPGSNVDESADLHLEEAECPQFSHAEDRLKSLEVWPHPTLRNFLPATVAGCGFFHPGFSDALTCFYCGNTLVDWSEAIQSDNKNIVQLEHARFFPCRFVASLVGPKFIGSATFFHPISEQERRRRCPVSILPDVDIQQDFSEACDSSDSEETSSSSSQQLQLEQRVPQTIDECLSTFARWPRYAPISANALAHCGFYYTNKDLITTCFKCNLTVDDWQHGMTALGTHRTRPRIPCELVRAIDATITGEAHMVSEKWRYETLKGCVFPSSLSANGLEHHTTTTTATTSPSPNTNKDDHLCRELAACGFYRVKNTQIIRCVYCRVTIEPRRNQSVMSQHRYSTKRLAIQQAGNEGTHSHPSSNIGCMIVYGQCPANVPDPHRQPFPEHPAMQSLYARRRTFPSRENGQFEVNWLHKVFDNEYKDLPEAGFFLDGTKHLRCFHCGNSLPMKDKNKRDKFKYLNVQGLHAHFFPTCEWIAEVVGPKYIAQVLYEHYGSTTSNDFNSGPRQSISASSSSASSSISFQAPGELLSPTSPDVQSQRQFEQNSYTDGDESDDEGDFNDVASPVSAAFLPATVLSPPPSSHGGGGGAQGTNDTTGTGQAAECTDISSPLSHSSLAPNPFKELSHSAEQNSMHGDASLQDVNGVSALSSPVSLEARLSHEEHRLETFHLSNVESFGGASAKELAYCGFYLTGEGSIKCYCCTVKFDEDQFRHEMRHREIRLPYEDQPTPMSVHRNAMGIATSKDTTWCVWVKRQMNTLYPNVVREKSRLKYPECPRFSTYQSRVNSFPRTWKYASGTKLSPGLMAQAGFYYMGEGTCVCCFYCGNKLKDFEPRDCPFEEHAHHHPLCDFILEQRGVDFVNRVLRENSHQFGAKIAYKTTLDGKQYKFIIWQKSGAQKSKMDRPPAELRLALQHSEDNENKDPSELCTFCCAHMPTHVYDPCNHCPMCGECYAKLSAQDQSRCCYCKRTIRIRLIQPNTPSPFSPRSPSVNGIG